MKPASEGILRGVLVRRRRDAEREGRGGAGGRGGGAGGGTEENGHG